MKKWYLITALILLAFNTIIAQERIKINEIMYNPEAGDADKQWIELFNSGLHPVNINGWILEKSAPKFEQVLIFPDINLKPDSFLVIGEKEVKEADIVVDLDLSDGKKYTAGVRILNEKGEPVDEIFYGTPNKYDLKTPQDQRLFAPSVKKEVSLCRHPDGEEYKKTLNFQPSPVPSPGYSNMIITNFSLENFEKFFSDKSTHTKFKALSRIVKLYKSFDDKKEIFKIANRTLDIARDLRDNDLIFNSYLYLGLISNYFGEYKDALNYFRKTLKINQKIGMQDNNAQIYNNLGMVYFHMGKYDSAMAYYEKSIDLKEKLDLDDLLATSYSNLASIYQVKGNYKEQIELLQKAYNLAISSQDKAHLMGINNTLGNAYKRINDYERAAEHYLKALRIAEQQRNNRYIAKFSNNLANIYKKLEDYNTALKYYKKAKNIFDEMRNWEFSARVKANMAATLVHLENYNTAKKYYAESLDVLKKSNKKHILAKIICNYGILFVKLNEFGKAEKYLNRSLDIIRDIGLRHLEPGMLVELGELRLKQNKFAQAESIYSEILSISREKNMPYYKQKSYQKLALIFSRRKKYKSAYKYLTKYIAIKDSIFNKEKAKQLSNMTLQYETSNLEQKVLSLQVKNELKELQTKTLLIQKYLFIAIIIILLLVGAFIMYRFYLNKRMNKKLSEAIHKKTKDLLKINENLRKQIEERKKLEEELKLSERLAVIGELAAELAHKIRNPLTIISSTAQFLNSDSVTKAELKKYSKQIIDSSNKANKIIKSLLKFSISSDSQNLCEDLVPVIKRTIETVKPTMNNKNIQITIDIPSELKCNKFDEKKLEEVFLNLLLNAISAIKNGGKLTISATSKEDIHIIRIKDTGKGIPEKDLDLIFKPFFTSKEDGTGLGLSLVRKIIENYGGSIRVDSKIEEGTEFTIEIPKK
ncbi:MAG: tetratricopeptide repeat protein [Candidatus Cloacimonetes bacterium]|nr:tetratricopeptide repeat protein [Candidatus Cloacimonadota bacterium]MBS3767575.1 tetratricopeptide repeat protein [Candidatus Cloacimonadota bacterium]